MSDREKIIDGILYVTKDDGKTWQADNGEGDGGEIKAGKGRQGDNEKTDEAKEITKAAEAIISELKDYNTIQKNQAQKKADLDTDVKVTDVQFKLYENHDTGLVVEMSRNEAELTGKWMQSRLKSLIHSDPLEFIKAKQIRQKLDDIAISQKLEPLNAATDAEGGFLIPTILFNKIIPLVEDVAVMRSRATVIDMTGMGTNTLNITGIKSKPFASWNGEQSQKATSTAEFNQISLTPYNLALILVVTQDLVDGSPFNTVKILTALMSDAIAKAEDEAFFAGNGSGRPTGIDNYTFPGKKTFSAGGDLDWTHLNSAFWRLNSVYRKKAIWAMHTDTLETISNFQDSNGNPILKEEGALINDRGEPTIKRKPALEQNDFGSNKLFFFDPSAYWIGFNRSLTLDISKEATIRGQNMFERNMIALRLEERIDGELTTTQAGVEITNVRT